MKIRSIISNYPIFCESNPPTKPSCKRQDLAKLCIARRKRHFILLEVMIALTLVASCTLYTLISPVQIYKKEKELFQATEYERIIDLSFVEVRERLYSEAKDHNLEKIAKGTVFSLSPIKFDLPGLNTEIERSYFFRIKETDAPKLDKEGNKIQHPNTDLKEARHLLLEVVLQLKPIGSESTITSSQNIFVKKKP